MNIYLIGYMYSGKSTIGRQLANTLGATFTDLDNAIEEHYHTSISLIFQRYGESAFRLLEKEMLHSTMPCADDQAPHVISTGGGTPCFHNNIEWINQHGVSVYLKLGSQTILQRLHSSKRTRPLLHNLSADQQLSHIEQQLRDREPFYTQAAHTIECDEVETQQIIATIAALVH